MNKKLHKVHDTFVKNLLSHKESASEFLKHALHQELFRHFDLKNITYLPGTYVTKELNEFISDIVLKIPLNTSKEVTVSILVEHKSAVDHLTCIQLLSYISNAYELQRKQKENLSIIIPIIYYHGKGKWLFRPLDELFADVPEAFRKFIPSYQVELFAVQEYTVPQIHKIAETRLRAAMMVQKGQYDNLVAIMDYVRVINSLEDDATGNFLFTLFVYLSNMTNFEKESIIDITNHLTTEMKTKSKTFIDQFREEGIAIGIEKGIEKGSLQSRYEFARKLLLRNVPLKDICELTELTLEEVKGIKV